MCGFSFRMDNFQLSHSSDSNKNGGTLIRKELIMKKILFTFLMLIIAGSAFAADFSIKSTSWQDGKPMDNKYVYNSFGCTGENISPEVSWDNPPEGTKSFAVTVYDPDAPTGSGWWHWTVANVPSAVKELPE